MQQANSHLILIRFDVHVATKPKKITSFPIHVYEIKEKNITNSFECCSIVVLAVTSLNGAVNLGRLAGLTLLGAADLLMMTSYTWISTSHSQILCTSCICRCSKTGK